jgi:hypothetical protein
MRKKDPTFYLLNKCVSFFLFRSRVDMPTVFDGSDYVMSYYTDLKALWEIFHG